MSKKKKVGILTINDYTNYGNRLQNYATQEVVKSFGFEVKTIVNKTEYIKSKNTRRISNRLKRIIKMSPKKILNKTIKKIKFIKNRISKTKQKKVENFKKFTYDYINETNYEIHEDNIISGLDLKYDFFITGSDQVWNPTFGHNSKIDFLTFASKEKRIAFAPSFGISEIPKEYVDDFTKWLNGFSKISVREKAGADIIKRLTGKNAEVLVDPTMLLNKEEWLDIAKPTINKPKSKYLLTYILGNLSKSKRKRINDIAKKRGLEIIDLTDVNSHNIFVSGPREFLDLINSADLFLTDSFHGTIFSIIFNTPFVIFKRNDKLLDMTSRIDTILDKFDLKDRYEMNLKQINKIYNIDFNHTDEILENEKNKSFEFLKKSLSVE